jgi:hypothetical protein
MKTNYSKNISMLLVFISLGIISCTKESDSPTPVNVPSNDQSSNVLLGSLVDFGMVNGDTRMMKMVINPRNFNLYDSNGELSNTSAQFELSFYVNEDGIIPVGEYTYSSSDIKSPFTFDSGIFKVANNSQPDQVLDGSINVSRDGGNYVFSFQAALGSGMTFSETYHGSIQYSDSK